VASHFISGIDVSHHNGDIDYTKVRQAGNAFVIAKATQDNEFIDPMFLTNVARARAAGLTMGGYHFFDYTLDGRAQADHFVDRLELAGAIDDALPPVVDVECWAPIGSSIHAVSAARLRDFVARVYERTGRLPIIYTSVFMWKQVVGNANGFEDLPLWAACWGCEAPPSIAPGWEDWAFWQTGVNRIKGVGRLDGNYFAGSIEDLESLRLRPLAIAAGAPVTADQRVHIDIGGRTATHLRTSPDGESWSDWRAIRSMPRATLSALEGPQTLYVQLRSGARLESPVYRDAITLDRSGPEVTSPTLSLRVGPLESEPVGVPVEVAWQAVDATAGLSDASLEMACDSAGPSSSEVPGSAEPGQQVPWSGALRVPIDRCDITVVSRDGVGNESRTEAGEVELVIHPADAGADSDADADSVATTGLAGDQVGVMAVRGPDRGRANVLLDGEPVGLVDLYAPEATGPELVLVVDLASGARQRISVEATGDRDPAASGGSVAIEGFVTLATG